MSRMERRNKRKASKTMLVIGIVLIVIAIGVLLIKPIQTVLLNRNLEVYDSKKIDILEKAAKNSNKNLFDKNVENTDSVSDDYNFDSVDRLNIATIAEARSKVDFSRVIGAIVVPDLKMNLPIFEGLDNYNLTYGAGTMKKNQVMGEGNYSLAGHNYPKSPKILFSPLVKINKNTYMYTTDFSYIYVYNTTLRKIISPESVNVINDSYDKNELTLITCNDVGDKRYMIKADFVEKIPVDEASQELKDYFGFDFTFVSE